MTNMVSVLSEARLAYHSRAPDLISGFFGVGPRC